MEQSRKGFTLIEILVVISIISLLSSFVLASLGSARVKARNSARNSQVLEYAKALALYKADKGSFPKGDGDYYCLGTYLYPSNKCDFYEYNTHRDFPVGLPRGSAKEGHRKPLVS